MKIVKNRIKAGKKRVLFKSKKNEFLIDKFSCIPNILTSRSGTFIDKIRKKIDVQANKKINFIFLPLL